MVTTIINHPFKIWEWFIPPTYGDLGDGFLLFYPHDPQCGKPNNKPSPKFGYWVFIGCLLLGVPRSLGGRHDTLYHGWFMGIFFRV